MIDNNHDNCECIHVQPFRSITKTYEGVTNDEAEVIVDNEVRTIEVKLKPQQYGSRYAFPNIGNPTILYVDILENKTYRWDSTTNNYECIGSDYTQIKIINGGKANYEY